MSSFDSGFFPRHELGELLVNPFDRARMRPMPLPVALHILHAEAVGLNSALVIAVLFIPFNLKRALFCIGQSRQSWDHRRALDVSPRGFR